MRNEQKFQSDTLKIVASDVSKQNIFANYHAYTLLWHHITERNSSHAAMNLDILHKWVSSMLYYQKVQGSK